MPPDSLKIFAQIERHPFIPFCPPPPPHLKGRSAAPDFHYIKDVKKSLHLKKNEFIHLKYVCMLRSKKSEVLKVRKGNNVAYDNVREPLFSSFTCCCFSGLFWAPDLCW